MSVHMRREIDNLKGRLLSMAARIEDVLARSVAALSRRDGPAAQAIIDGDAQIDRLEVEVEEDCLKILALYQPVAADLRFVVAVLKMNNDLERMGDLAVNIAERTLDLIRQPRLKPLIDIPRMAAAAQRMVRDVLTAFIERDADLARDICRRDSEVDQLNDQVFRELLTYMMQDSTTIARAVDLILVGRNLERIADHATNIAEDVIYLVEGKTIKHHCEQAARFKPS